MFSKPTTSSRVFRISTEESWATSFLLVLIFDDLILLFLLVFFAIFLVLLVIIFLAAKFLSLLEILFDAVAAP